MLHRQALASAIQQHTRSNHRAVIEGDILVLLSGALSVDKQRSGRIAFRIDEDKHLAPIHSIDKRSAMLPNPNDRIIPVGRIGPYPEAEFHARAPYVLCTERLHETVAHHSVGVWTCRTLICGALPSAANGGNRAGGPELLRAREIHPIRDRDFHCRVHLQRLANTCLQLVARRAERAPHKWTVLRFPCYVVPQGLG